MAVIKALFGPGGVAIGCTLAGLAANAFRQSAVIDNSANLFLEALVQLKIKTAAAGVSTTGYVAVYAYASANDGVTYSDGASGADAAFTPTVPHNLHLLGIINAVAVATTYVSSPMSVAAACGGVVPARWGIVVENKTGAALDATEANHATFYQGVQAQTA